MIFIPFHQSMIMHSDAGKGTRQTHHTFSVNNHVLYFQFTFDFFFNGLQLSFCGKEELTLTAFTTKTRIRNVQCFIDVLCNSNAMQNVKRCRFRF